MREEVVGTGEREGGGDRGERRWWGQVGEKAEDASPLGQGETLDFDSNCMGNPLRAWNDLIYNFNLSLWLLWGEREGAGGAQQRGTSAAWSRYPGVH